MRNSLLALGVSIVAAGALCAAPTSATAPTPVPSGSPGGHVSSPAPSQGKTPHRRGIVGAGCSALPASGKGSLADMANHRLATAVADNPELTSLSKAIKRAGLTDQLNKAKDITFLAPDNQAFGANMAKLNKKQLTQLLEHHVIEGSKTPAQLTSGPLKTKQGGTMTAKGSGDNITISGRAKVVCGGFHTKNATVYIIDKILPPRSGG
ncbi:fasciclin domain-containing protein [Nonomuraea sp. CA-141351]|uniref:fasciclin domain-containing protein n=1 Tax=Nonomuraea sp. CA-141351 TaxID=3239996 RepID=UPI003D914F71